jgi:hypothetical protein
VRFEEALRARLVADPTVAAIFGTRIYPDVIAEGSATPCAVYFRVDDRPWRGIRQDSTWRTARVQFSIYATSKDAAREAAAAIYGSIGRFRGTISGVYFDDVLLDAERDLYEDVLELRHVAQDFIVTYSEV